MSDNSSEQEPSIEEILASIRQIISDDDEDGQEAQQEAVESPIRDSSDNVLELTEEDLVESEPEPEPIDDLDEMEVDMVDRDAEQPIEEPEEEEEPEVMADDILEEIRSQGPSKAPVPSEILSSGTQAAALGSLNKLSSKMPINNSRSYDGVTLEDIVREQLHPMLREWMDDNLPRMVERLVQKELEKLARRALDD